MIVEVMTYRPDVQPRLGGDLPKGKSGEAFSDHEAKSCLDNILATLFEVNPGWHSSKISQL